MDHLYLIVGLGNPGEEYARTRHNAGFMLGEALAERWKFSGWKLEEKFRAQMARGQFDRWSVCLAKPLTFMNESGWTVGRMRDFFKIAPEKLLVAVDDADLPFGEIRLRADGSPGGHHGLESVEAHLGTRQYARLRIGIGRKPPGERQIRDYVLGNFGKADEKLLNQVLDRAGAQVECWLRFGIAKAMSQFNGVVATPTTKES